ncbi:hypothetical protein Hanom_Chr09g00819501 [Helianthus anomalus]
MVVLDDGGAGPAANSGDAGVAAMPKTKPNNGKGRLDDVTSDHWTPSLNLRTGGCYWTCIVKARRRRMFGSSNHNPFKHRDCLR